MHPLCVWFQRLLAVRMESCVVMSGVGRQEDVAADLRAECAVVRVGGS